MSFYEKCTLISFEDFFCFEREKFFLDEVVGSIAVKSSLLILYFRYIAAIANTFCL